MKGVSVHKLGEKAEENSPMEFKDEVAWRLLEESRPCRFRRKHESGVWYWCFIINAIFYGGKSEIKSKVKPERCLNCMYSDKLRKE